MRLGRYCIAGFLNNSLAFIFWTVVYFRSAQLGATPTQLALLQTSSSVVYVLSALFSGGLSDRVSRSALARWATVMSIAVCAATVYSLQSLSLLYVMAPLLGLAGSVYWPSIQGAVGAESEPSQVERSIGGLNVSWSVGKTLSFAVAGWLVETRGPEFTLWLAAGAGLPILLLYPGDKVTRREGTHEAGRSDTAVFRIIGYIANFLAFGVGNVFSSQFVKYAKDSGIGGDRPGTLYGLVLGAMYAAQTLMFVVLQRGSAWTYKRSLLYGTQLLAGAAGVAVTFVRSDGALMASAALVGVGLGFANASSIYYSLHGPADHGKYAGVHEAVLGAGSFLVPLAGGALADLRHDLRMPYWLAGGLTLLVLAIQEIVYRRRLRS